MTLTKDGLTRKEKQAKWYQENKKRISKETKEYKKEYYKHNKQRVADGLSREGISPKPKLTEEERKERNRISHLKYKDSPKGTETRKKYESTAKFKASRLEYRNRPEVKERVKKRYAENKESLLAYARAYREVNADVLNAKERDKNKTAESIAYRKAYYLKRKEEGYCQTEEYKEKARIYRHKKRWQKKLEKK